MLLRYALRRLILAVPLLLGISVLTFALLHLTPGNPVQQQMAMNPHFSAASAEALRRLYGMDQPLPLQYWHWLSRLARFDFGLSLRDQQPVLGKILAALPATLFLNFASLVIALGIAIPFGVHSATHPRTRLPVSSPASLSSPSPSPASGWPCCCSSAWRPGWACCPSPASCRRGWKARPGGSACRISCGTPPAP